MNANEKPEHSLATASQQIDAMVLRHDSPSEVVSFLREVCKTFSPEDVFADVLTLGTIFSLDFALQCTPEDRSWLVDNVFASPNHAAYFAWQAIASKSSKADQLKFQLRQRLDTILLNGPVHPYKWNHSRYVMQLDSAAVKLSQAARFTDLAYLINSNSQLSDELMSGWSYSVFRSRILQYDVYKELSPLNQYMLLKAVQSSSNYAKEHYVSSKTGRHLLKNSFHADLLIQIIDNAENLEMKHMAYLVLKQFDDRSQFISNDAYVATQECGSFGEFEFKTTIAGENFHTRDMVIYLLLNQRSWLNSWIKSDREEVDSLLKCSDLVSYMRKH